MDNTTSTTPSPPPTDPRPALGRALATAAATLTALDAESGTRRSPCGEWTALDVGRHLVAVADRITAVGQRRDPNPLPVLVDLPPAGIAPAFDTASSRLERAWADPSILGDIVTVPWGRVPGAVAAGVYTVEVLVHTWDLARALGVDVDWVTEDVEAALATARLGIPAEPRGGEIPFAPPTEPAQDAPPADRLAAWLGRQV